MSSLQRILIVCHTFPPDDGIGGRRWAKFAKYLTRHGISVEVIAADLNTDAPSPWVKDIKGIPVHRYRHRFPRALAAVPTDLVGKIAYRVALARMKRRLKGSPYDRAALDRSAYLQVLDERIKSFCPQIVVVSGAPFNLLWFTAQVRERYPLSAFVADLRDPWIGGDAYGYGNLRGGDEAFEVQKEVLVMDRFNRIVSPWQGVVDDLKTRHPPAKPKIALLSHAWDRDDLPERIPASMESVEKNDLDLVFGGNLYRGFDEFFEKVAAAAQKDRRRVAVYTNEVSRFSAMVNPYFMVRPRVDSRSFMTELSRYRRLLFLIPEALKNGFPTKLLEYAATGRPLVAVGHAGSLSELITTKALGSFSELSTAMANPALLWKDRFDASLNGAWVARYDYASVSEGFIRGLENFLGDGFHSDIRDDLANK